MVSNKGSTIILDSQEHLNHDGLRFKTVTRSLRQPGKLNLSPSNSQIFSSKIFGSMILGCLIGLTITSIIPSPILQFILLHSVQLLALSLIPKICHYDPLNPDSIVNSNPNCNLESQDLVIHVNFFIIFMFSIYMGHFLGPNRTGRHGSIISLGISAIITCSLMLAIFPLWPGGMESVKKETWDSLKEELWENLY